MLARGEDPEYQLLFEKKNPLSTSSNIIFVRGGGWTCGGGVRLQVVCEGSWGVGN